MIWVDSQASLSNLSDIFSQKNETPSGEAVLKAIKILSELQRTYNFGYAEPVLYQLSVEGGGRSYVYRFASADEGNDHDRNVAIAVVSFLDFIRKIASFCFVELELSRFEKPLNIPGIVDFIADSEITIEDYEGY